MEPTRNPYAPGSGLRPPAMVGRDREVAAFETVIIRTANGLHNRGMVLSGLRGVGKTVLLNELHRLADSAGWFAIGLEAKVTDTGAASVRAKLARELAIGARRMNKPTSSERLREALHSVSSFSASLGATGLSLGISVAPGRADSGTLEIDLEEMVEDLSLALQTEHRGFAIFIDEMQDLDRELLVALVAAQHAAGQKGWPFYLIGAGLPNLPATLSDARSYAERLFDYRVIGPLDSAQAEAALSRPAEQAGARYEAAALATLVGAADGYPYFLQEFGKATWDLAPRPVFTDTDADAAVELGMQQLDQGFFPSRWDRATRSERRYLRAMAEDGDGGSSTGVIAERLTLKTTSLGPARAQLIAKGLIYAPEHGVVAYTVPGMSAYIHRQHQDA